MDLEGIIPGEVTQSQRNSHNRYIILFVTIEKGVVSIISFSACLPFVYRKAIDLFELILYLATSLKLFIRLRSSLVDI